MPNPHTAKHPSSFKTPNQAAQQNIRPKHLPLHCPLPGTSLWNSHPRIFLPIEDMPDRKIRCPYCGTLYTLVDSDS
ncbi:MAG: zinc-finger domain-containing protein [Gammaproteobacteria bacterium]|nr:zinc-finger domain-containing protein [Gammaproteobacteria bacterium]